LETHFDKSGPGGRECKAWVFMQHEMGEREKRVEIAVCGIIFLMGELHQNE
jgi:hypothetical protein